MRIARSPALRPIDAGPGRSWTSVPVAVAAVRFYRVLVTHSPRLYVYLYALRVVARARPVRRMISHGAGRLPRSS